MCMQIWHKCSVFPGDLEGGKWLTRASSSYCNLNHPAPTLKTSTESFNPRHMLTTRPDVLYVPRNVEQNLVEGRIETSHSPLVSLQIQANLSDSTLSLVSCVPNLP